MSVHFIPGSITRHGRVAERRTNRRRWAVPAFLAVATATIFGATQVAQRATTDQPAQLGTVTNDATRAQVLVQESIDSALRARQATVTGDMMRAQTLIQQSIDNALRGAPRT